MSLKETDLRDSMSKQQMWTWQKSQSIDIPAQRSMEPDIHAGPAIESHLVLESLPGDKKGKLVPTSS